MFDVSGSVGTFGTRSDQRSARQTVRLWAARLPSVGILPRASWRSCLSRACSRRLNSSATDAATQDRRKDALTPLVPRPVSSMLSAVMRPASVTCFRVRSAARCWLSGARCAKIATSLRRGAGNAVASGFIVLQHMFVSNILHDTRAPWPVSRVQCSGPAAAAVAIAAATGQHCGEHERTTHRPRRLVKGGLTEVVVYSLARSTSHEITFVSAWLKLEHGPHGHLR